MAGSITDLTSGFKAIRRNALAEINLNSLNARGYIFQVSLLHAFLEKGFTVCEVPITFTNRQHGSSKLSVSDVLEFLYRAYKLNPDAPIQRLVRFGVVGTCGTVVNLILLTTLIKLGRMNALVADIIAIEGSIIFNFFLNHHYTFRGYGPHTKRSNGIPLKSLLVMLGKFNLGALSGALISFAMFAGLNSYLSVPYVLADIVAIISAMSWNYWVSTRFVWKTIDADIMDD